jgi:hypothetical protein
MKKFTLILSMMIALVGLNANAAIYLVGAAPFGEGWDPSKGVEMTDNGDGTYSFTAEVNGAVYFCFADGLDNSWDVFNGTFRFGPTGGTDQIVTAGEWTATQRQGNGNGSYKFTGTGEEYTVTFDETNLQFKVEGYVAPITEDVYTVAGSSAVLFGTTWDPANADNDMTLVEGLYTWEKKNVELAAGSFAFKVTANHSWDIAYPANDYYQAIDADGIYDVKITFNADNKDVNCELTLIQEVIPEIRGDVDRDGNVNIADVTTLIDYLLSGQTAPATADCDKDGNVNIADVTTLIDYLLSGSWPVEEMVYTVVGPAEIFGSNWDTNDENNNMVKGADGIYTWSKEGVTLTGNFKFKVVGNHDYSIYEWPIGGDWIANVGEEGIYTIVITFDPEAEADNRITCTLTKTGDIDPIEHVYTVAGTANLCGIAWDPSIEENNMVKGEDGIYTLVKDGIVLALDEEIEFKVVQDHSWVNSWPSENWLYHCVEAGVYSFVITFDPAADDMNKITLTFTKWD